MVLVPSVDEDIEYIVGLAFEHKFNRDSKERIRERFERTNYATWIIYRDDKRCGVCMIMMADVGYKLDGYKETREKGVASTSVLSARMLIDWCYQKKIISLWTMHDVNDRASTILTLRLGFKEVYRDKAIILRRDIWG
jgi:hypothetical protein